MINPKPLFDAQQLPLLANIVTLYTCPPNQKCVVTKFTLFNADTDARLVSVFIVPASGSAGDANAIWKDRVVAPGFPGEVFEIEGQTLKAGDMIQAYADVADKVGVQGSGLEIAQ